jgi:predicted GH43/DUF377 family glycosyl hydrolase
MKNFSEFVLNRGGKIKPLVIDSSLTNGTGLFNPSIFVDYDNKIYVNIRHCQYTLYHSEKNLLEHPWGPLLYLNPENDITLTTKNYFGELNDDLTLKYCHAVDTSALDIQSVWEFVGLEDARIVRWNEKLYLSGVRRDVKTNGEGRMELSELEISESGVKEISRFRVPAPDGDNSYCEKNWMPILDLPYHYLKWCNPVDIVKVSVEEKTCQRTFLGDRLFFDWDQRGGGQVISFEDGYLSLIHETFLEQSLAGRKDGTYRHRFIYWNKNWEPIKRSERFSFLEGKIEFACGLAKRNDEIFITFGFQDNAAYVIKSDVKTVKDFIYA